MTLTLHDYSYELPQELIAQSPAEPRDSSRLMVLSRTDGSIAHRTFTDLPELLRPGDALVCNDSRVLHARLRGTREASGGKVELLLLRPLAGTTWESMARPAKRLREGENIVLASGARVRFLRRLQSDTVEVEVPSEVVEHLELHGALPLPPYIRSYRGNENRYQTVYADAAGSVAAPTAGLHFTSELLDRLSRCGVGVHYLTLHVGAGTFAPVKTAQVEEHVMHSERFYVPGGLSAELARVGSAGGRVVAVGTTVARTLETIARVPEQADTWSETDIFIRPGHSFALVDGLVTNFHLPHSTLLMLVSALAGRERVLSAYEVAIRERYRFYSFGDAMLII